MKFETWKTKTMQRLADDIQKAQKSPAQSFEGISVGTLERAFDKFSHNELAQHQAYAVCNGGEPQDLITIITICTI